MGRLKSLIPSDQFQLIIGSLMGDARLECRSKSIRAKHTARMNYKISSPRNDLSLIKGQAAVI